LTGVWDVIACYDLSGSLLDQGASGYQSGGFVGTVQAWAANAGSALLAVVGAHPVGSLSTSSGNAFGTGHPGLGWAYGGSASVLVVANALTLGRFNPEGFSLEFQSMKNAGLYELGSLPMPNAVYTKIASQDAVQKGLSLIQEFGSTTGVLKASQQTAFWTSTRIYFTTTATPACQVANLGILISIDKLYDYGTYWPTYPLDMR